ncbi:MAG: helix-turn-helix transcriptional regulator [Bacteroidales bacterium]|jgi:DNA-binding HxlR family transcriptional regulator|nr:helix-turn-helix transcriptional regulator [Bacteroidales bacterium]
MNTFLHIGDCPVRDILAGLGNKWSLLTLITLNSNGTMRFNDIRKSIGDISPRMLSVTLKNLQRDGIIARTAYPQIPPRVEYYITSLGKSFIPLLKELTEWAKDNMQEILASRKKSI